MLDGNLRVDPLVLWPIVLIATGAFKELTACFILTKYLRLADLARDDLVLFLLLHIDEFFRGLPIVFENWLSISSEVMNLQKMEVAIFILQKVAHEHVHRTFFLRVDVSLREDLVDGVDGSDSVWI